MATTYTTQLQLALPTAGELDGTWGTTVNDNITKMLEEAIAGIAAVSTWAGASHTLTTANGTTAEARCMILLLSGAPGAAGTVLTPAVGKVYLVNNSVTGGYAVTVKVSGQTGVSIPNGATMWLYCNGTDIVTGGNYAPSLTLGAALPVASGGTGVTTSTGTGNVVLSTSPTLVTPALGTPASGVLTNCTGGPTLTNSTLVTPTITGYTETAYTANSGAAITLDLANGTLQIITLNAATPAITMPAAGAGKSFLLFLKQDATGSRVPTWATVAWPSASAPTLTTTASRMDVISFVSDGTKWYGAAGGLNYTP